MGFMNLTLPTVSVTLGPLWASELNEALGTIENHDHTSGKGKRITTGAMNIDADLDINLNRLVNVLSTKFSDEVAPLAGATHSASVNVSGGDLYFTNGSGVAVQITDGGSVITTPASIESMQLNEVSIDTIIGAGDSTVFLAVDTSGAAREVTLPLASAVVAGRIYAIKDATGDSEANALTISANGSDTIDGAASQVVQSDFGTVFVIGNGVDAWYIV